MPDDFEVLSALLDGDGVDLEELEMALDDPGGRRLFVDFVRLRQMAANDDATARPELYDRMQSELRVNQRLMTRRVPLPLAVAAILVAMMVGSFVDLDLGRSNRGPAAPPETARVLRFEPGVDWQP